MKIVFLYPLSNEAYNYLIDELPNDIQVVAKIRGVDEINTAVNEMPDIIEECRNAEILLGPYVTEEILKLALPANGGKLKLIFIPWTGIDRLNLDLIKKYNIPVANSHSNARTVAEFAIALLMTASKNIIHHDRLLRNGDWSSRFQTMPSILITGKTVGLLGFGAIGTECAKMLQGFEVKMIACRRTPSKSTEQQKQLAEKIYSYKEINQFLAEADIIINSLPLTDDTKGLINKEKFSFMKDSSIMINIGRGETIDEEAFYEAMKSGKLFAAGLDPQWHYPPRNSDTSSESNKTYPSNYPIQEFDNVVLSPHRAAHIKTIYEIAHWKDVIENILRIYHIKEPLNLVDLEKGY